MYYLDKMIDAKLEQSQRLRDLATKVSPILVQDKVFGGGGKNLTEEYICKWIDLDNEINADIDHLVDLKKEIEGVISRVKDPRYRLLLTLRYLNYKKWEDIADCMDYDEVRWVYRLHKKALTIVSHVMSVI